MTTIIEKPAAQYGFHGRLSAEFPSQIVIDVTEVCNLACIHCPHPEFKKSEHYSASYLDPELNHGLMGLFVQGRTFRKPPDLTPRENEVLRLTAWGYSNKEIASRLGLSVKTVEVHKTNGMRKLGMNSRLQLVRYALLRNWFQDT